MSIEVQHRRGTTAQHAEFTGKPGEITVDTDKGVAVVHDGKTAGGHPLAREDTLTGAVKRLDKIKTYKPNTPTFVWSDDDAKEFFYTDLAPWAEARNISVMIAVPTSLVGTTHYMSISQIQEMSAAGHIVGSHTVNHVRLPECTSEQIVDELVNSKAAIESWGVPCDYMVYPYGDHTDEIVDETRKHYICAFSAGGPIGDTYRMNFPPIDTYQLERCSIEASSDLEAIKAQIDYCIANNGLMIFMSHIGYYGSVTTEEMDAYTEVYDYIVAAGYGFDSIETAFEKCRNIIEVGNLSHASPANYFVVGSDGKASGSVLGGLINAPTDKYTNGTPPSAYTPGCVTINAVSTVGASGLPSNTRGILSAYCLGTIDLHTWYRSYLVYTTNKLYTQVQSSSSDAWSAWAEVNSNYLVQATNNAITAAVTPTDVPLGISVCLISDSAALSALPGGEDGTLGAATIGYLTSYKISTTAQRTREEWQPLDAMTKYVRRASSSSAWGAWYKVTPVAL